MSGKKITCTHIKGETGRNLTVCIIPLCSFSLLQYGFFPAIFLLTLTHEVSDLDLFINRKQLLNTSRH